MAYTEHGSVASAEELIDRIVTFAVANGWTLYRNVIAGTSRTATLRKEGVSDYVHLYNTSTTLIRMRISIGFDIEQTPANQPNVSNEAWCTVLAGPYPKAFLFASGNQVWVTVSIARSGEYRHLTFGVLDKVGVYDGGTYADGSSWGQSSNTWGSFNNNPVPFLNPAGGNTTRGVLRADVIADGRTNYFFEFEGSTNTPNPRNIRSDIGVDTDALAGVLVARADRNAFSGRSIFHAIPLYVSRIGATTYYSPAGVVRDVRFCSINKFEPEQEVTIGSDVYKVFPAAAKRTMVNGTGEQPAASGDYAYAIRKVP